MRDAGVKTPPLSPPCDGSQCLNAETYAELRRIAGRRMAQMPAGTTLQPTALVHEAWLRLSRRKADWQGQGHFLAGAATAMRHILIDEARRKTRLRHGGGLNRAETVGVAELAAPGPDERLLLIDEAVRALEKIDPLRAEVVVARFFGGLTNREIAEALEIGERSVDRHWAAAKVWLFRWMQSASKS